MEEAEVSKCTNGNGDTNRLSFITEIPKQDKMTVNGILSSTHSPKDDSWIDPENITKSSITVTKRPNSLSLLKPIPSLKSAEDDGIGSSSGSSSSNILQDDDLIVEADLIGACGLVESPLRGTVIKEGDMVLFVAENLQEKIKMSSPNNKKGDTPSLPSSRGSSLPSSRGSPTLYRQALAPKIPPIDPACLRDLELQASKVASSLHIMLANLTSSLHNMSSLTVDCIKTYRDAVDSTCDTMDASIKTMYQLMAKCEELSNTMKPVYQAMEQIKEIKRLLDLLEDLIG